MSAPEAGGGRVPARSAAGDPPRAAAGDGAPARAAAGGAPPEPGAAERELLELPFDQYQRYRLVADLCARLRAGGPPLEVLDVGGRTALLRRFLPDARITLVDLEPSSERGLVLGDGSRLPFRDGSFDLVCAFDTLEHVPPPRRGAFVAECGRVARRWVVLAGPYDSPRVAQAERLLQRFLREKLGARHRYLEEHRHNGLPDRGAVERQLAGLGGEVRSIPHANLERWLVLMCLALYLDEDPSLRGLARAFHAFYNRALYASDHAEPVYRHAVIAAFEGAPLPETEDLLGPPRAPAGALEPFAALTSELAAFDRERGEWRAERERLRQIARDLEEDLGGHREALEEAHAELESKGRGVELLTAELAAEQKNSRETRAALEADLAEHAGTLAALERDLAEERREGAEARAALEADLAEHRATASSLRASLEEERRQGEEARAALQSDLDEHARSLEALRAELEEQRALARHLEGEIARVEGIAREIQTELVHANEGAAALNATLADRERELERLRSELRDRWRNLKRALSPRKPPF